MHVIAVSSALAMPGQLCLSPASHMWRFSHTAGDAAYLEAVLLKVKDSQPRSRLNFLPANLKTLNT